MVAAKARKNARRSLVQKIKDERDEVFAVRLETHPTEKSLIKYLDSRNRSLPPLWAVDGLHQVVKIGYEAERLHEEERLQATVKAMAKIVHPDLYATPCAVDERMVVERSIRASLDGFSLREDKEGGPRRMADHFHYEFEHSLHTPKLLTYRGQNEASRKTYGALEVPLSDVVGGLFHDYFEDVPEEQQKSLDELVDSIAGDLPEHRAEVRRGLRIAQRLTLTKNNDYFKGLESISEIKGDLPLDEERREIAGAWRVKLADKLSSVRMTNGLNYHKVLKTIIGKTYKTINESRRWYYSLSEEEQEAPENREVLLLSVQLAMAGAKSMKYLLKTLRDDLRRFSPDRLPKSQEFNIDTAMSDRMNEVEQYLRQGGLQAQEYNATDEYPYLAGTIRSTKLLGMHLSTSGAYIEEKLRLRGETSEDARDRLHRERCEFEKLIPDLRVPDYLDALELDPALLTEQQGRLRDLFPNKEDGFEAFSKRLPSYLMVVQSLFRKFAADEKVYFPGGF